MMVGCGRPGRGREEAVEQGDCIQELARPIRMMTAAGAVSVKTWSRRRKAVVPRWIEACPRRRNDARVLL
jgi:hypothetical protein